MLFHACKARGDAAKARQAAAAIWAESEGGRKQLEAMGERPLGNAPALAPQKASARDKAAATR
jgi:hypothetical protein